MDGLPPELRTQYVRDFCLADQAYNSGQLVATTVSLESCWQNWLAYIEPLGVEPHLQGVKLSTRCRILTELAQQVREGYYGRGSTVCSGTVCTAITAIGQIIALAHLKKNYQNGRF